jgi:hypothetical protein
MELAMRKQMSVRLAGVALFAGAAVLSCGTRGSSDGPRSSTNSERQGTVGLGLVPVSGVTLNSVHYVVTNGATPAVTISEGDLPTPGTAKDFSVGLTLPVGSGYTISLSAASAETGDNITCGASYGTFSVAPNAATNFSLTLTCHDDSNGQIAGKVDTKTDACPKIVFDYVIATKANVDVGADTTVLGKAHDLDGKALTYTWKLGTPAIGTFTPATGASSTLHCSAKKPNEVVTVTANNGECSKSLTTTVSCVEYTCGNGVIDAGEVCDWAIPGVPCPADCTYVCGDGVAEAPVEDCDPGNTANCDSTCHTRDIACNDGWLGAGEQCDATANPPVPPGTPSNKKCDNACHLFEILEPVLCGNGVVNSGEECDGALTQFSSNASSPTCSNTCKKISTQACVDCENAGDCFESVDNCLGVSFPFNSAQQGQCYDVMRCIEASNCLDGTGTLGKCYCGDLSISACGAAPYSGPGSPNGACVNEIKAGFPTLITNSAVLGGLVATDFPSGAAMKRLACQKGANSSACLGVCGFTAGGPVFP